MSSQETRALALPLTFRQKMVETIMGCVQSGNSCVIVGAPGTGKTNLLRFLCRKDVQKRYLGSDAQKALFVRLDANQSPDLSAWQSYLPFMDGLRRAVEDVNRRTDGVAECLSLLDFRSVASARGYQRQRILRACLEKLCAGLAFRTVFLFDQFDRPFQELEDGFFLMLKGLRDGLEGDHKYRLCFIMALGEPPGAMRPKFDTACKPFHQLIAGNIYGLKPYEEQDARRMIERLANRHGEEIPDENSLRDFLWLTGGHAGLLRAVYDGWRAGQWPRAGNIDEELLEHTSIRAECVRLWDSLSREEKDVLGLIARDKEWPESRKDVVLYLRAKGLVKWPPRVRKPTIFSALFRLHVTRQLTIMPSPEPAA